MAKRPPASSLALQSVAKQLVLAVLAFAALAVLAYAEKEIFATKSSSAEETVPPVEIGLEYGAPVRIGLTFARKGDIGILKVTGDPATPLMISLPQAWKRTEVYGAKLSDITSEPPALGFTRWKIPAGAGMRLTLTNVPGQLTLISPSEHVAAVNIHAIDLLTNEQFDTVKLLQTETTASLWEMEN